LVVAMQSSRPRGGFESVIVKRRDESEYTRSTLTDGT
jgi:hypothetical protein